MCTYAVARIGVELQAVAEGLPREHNGASKGCGGVHAIPVVGLQQGARAGQASGERGGAVCADVRRGASGCGKRAALLSQQPGHSRPTRGAAA